MKPLCFGRLRMHPFPTATAPLACRKFDRPRHAPTEIIVTSRRQIIVTSWYDHVERSNGRLWSWHASKLHCDDFHLHMYRKSTKKSTIIDQWNIHVRKDTSPRGGVCFLPNPPNSSTWYQDKGFERKCPIPTNKAEQYSSNILITNGVYSSVLSFYIWNDEHIMRNSQTDVEVNADNDSNSQVKVHAPRLLSLTDERICTAYVSKTKTKKLLWNAANLFPI